MDKEIMELLEKECKKDGYDSPEDDEQLLEMLRDYDKLHEERISEHRWWNEVRYVIKVGDKYIGYVYAETTGDMSPSEVGYEFDSDTICEMEAVAETITTYQVKNVRKEDER